jgi:hypothetical protein
MPGNVGLARERHGSAATSNYKAAAPNRGADSIDAAHIVYHAAEGPHSLGQGGGRSFPLPCFRYYFVIAHMVRLCDYFLMKTILIAALLTLSISAFAADDDKAIAAIYSAVPAAKTVVMTSDGYRVRTDSGTVFVNKTSYGYRVQGAKTAAFITKTSDGYRVTPSR